MTETDPTELLSVDEACRAARMSIRHLYRHLESGALHAIKHGRRTLIRRSEINRFVATLPGYRSASCEAA